MAKMMYCPNCKCDVKATVWNTTRLLILLILFLLGGILGLIYLVYLLFQDEECPKCGAPIKFLQEPRFIEEPSSVPEKKEDGIYCVACGTSNNASDKYCKSCGNKLNRR